MPDIVSYQRACGVDVSKDTLDARILAEDVDQFISTANSPEGFARIIALCRKHGVQIVVAEASGGLQRPLAVALVEAQIPVAIVNPARIRHYALAEGLIAKTDQIDARIIALFALKIAPKAVAIRSQQMEELAGLAARKTQLTAMKVAEENRLQQATNPQVLKSIRNVLKSTQKQIDLMDKLLDERVLQDPVLQSKAQAADGVIGVGRASALALIVSMPELGTLTSKQAGSLAGLAPFNKDSGKAVGERRIAGGRASIRCALYMCALSAIRYDAKIKSFYQRLLAAGKCKMKAVTACMRKLLVIINARVREALAARIACPPIGQGGAAAAAGG
jgi:transposase